MTLKKCLLLGMTVLEMMLTFLLVMSFGQAAETRKEVVAQGKTDMCFGRETALNLAHVGASNDAHSECYALGKKWRFGGLKFPGYEQCRACGSSGEFKCQVTQAVYYCVTGRPDADKKVNTNADGKSPLTKDTPKEKGAIEPQKQTAAGAKPGEKKPSQTKGGETAAAKLRNILDDSAPSTGQGVSQAPGHLLDEAADAPKIERKLSQLRSDYRRQMEGQCTQVMSRINNCYGATPGCTPKSDNEIRKCLVDRCGYEPRKQECSGPLTCPPRQPRPGDNPNVSYLCIPSHCAAGYVDNPKYHVWEQCAAAASSCRVDTACVARCNPSGDQSVADCADKRMSGAPTRTDARNAYEGEVRQRQKTPARSVNFLD